MTDGLQAPRRPARVAYFHQSSDLYGSDRVLLDIASRMHRHGIEPIVFLPGPGPLPAALRAAGVESHEVPVVRLERAAMSIAGGARIASEAMQSTASVDRALRGRKIDVVHSNTLAVLGGALWAKRRGVPQVWHVHEILERPRAAAAGISWLVERTADAVICNSTATRNWLLGLRPFLEGRSRTVWNGVCAPAAAIAGQVAALRERYRPAAARLAVGLVGRINRMKGHALLLEAAELLAARGVTDFSLVFIGDAAPGQDELMSALRKRIAQSPVCERVVLTGFVADIWPSWQALDIACVPSTGPESFGLVAVEAMLSGKPVLAARAGGLPEIVRDQVDGLLFEARSAQALAAGLERLLREDGMRVQMGIAAAERARSTFTVDAMCEQVAQCYRGLAGGGG